MSEKPSYLDLELRLKEIEAEVHSQKKQIKLLKQLKTIPENNYDNLPLPYQSLDMDGRILEINQQWLNTLGYHREEILATSFLDILHPEEIEYFKTIFSTLHISDKALSVELNIINRNGTTTQFSLEGTIEHDTVNGFSQIHCILLDLTEHKNKEGKRHREQDIWLHIFDNISDIITIQNKNLSIVRANKAAQKLLSVNEADLTGQFCYEVFSGEKQPCQDCPLVTTVENGLKHSAEIHNTKLGKVFHVSSSLIPASNHGEEYLVHVAHDITEEIEIKKILQDSNERFSKVFASSPAPMVISEIDTGLFINVNQHWITMTGYRKEELIGQTSDELSIWQDPKAREYVVATLLQQGSVINYPVTILTQSGDTRSTLWSAEKININGKELMLSLISDVTEQKLAEEELRKSEEKFFLAFNASPDAININRLEDGLFVESNKGFTELTGFTKEDTLGKTSLDIDIWADPLDRQFLMQQLNEKGYCENLEAKFRRKDGRTATALMSARVIFLANTPHIISITRDISKLRSVEREVLEQKILFETMFNAIDDGVIITDTNREILFSNKAMGEIFGYLAEELKGKSTEILYSSVDSYQKTGKTFFSKDAIPKNKRYVSIYKHRLGKVFPCETFGVKLYDQDDKWIGNLAIMRDISMRLKSEAECDRLITAIEQTSDTIVITDKDAQIKYVNPAFESITGYTSGEVINKNPSLLKSDEQDESFYQEMWKILKSGRVFKGRMVNKRKDGKLFTEEATISPVYDRNGQINNFVAVKRDISDQIKLELQLQQAQKIEAVGRLTGGVAHDFNNFLGVIIGYTEMLLEQVDSNDKVHGQLQKILDAGQRSAEIVRQLLAFSRKQTASPKIVDLNKRVVKLLKLLHRLIGEDVEISWIPEPDTLLIKIDPAQIDQILANLCVNARDAITGNGIITIETRRVFLNQEYCDDHIGFHPGDFVLLSVSDNGCGFDKSTQEHIFEPFFTTKELGHGTGLGLSTVYGIVKQNEGFINVYSERNRGTTFKIYLPSCDKGYRETFQTTVAQTRENRGETILLVEDDPSLLDMTQNMLERIGYHILAAKSPNEGIEIAKKYSGCIDLLLTDIVMPEMNGFEMSKQIQTLLPNMKVLFTSGYTADVIARNGLLLEGVQFIEKPYSRDQLAQKLQCILNG